MKKILLSLTCLAIASGSFGQYSDANTIMKEKQPIDNSARIINTAKKINKKKYRGKRTYSFIDAIDQNEFAGAGLAFQNPSASPVWQDSTILQRYNTGYGAVNYSSFAAGINPASAFYNSSFYNGEMHITDNNAYTIDSIYLTGIYMNPNGTGATPGDKIRISVVLTSPDDMSFWQVASTSGTVAADYLNPTGTTDTELRGMAPDADSVGRIGGTPGGGRITWDYTLTNADTSMATSTNSYFYKRLGFAPPSPIAVAAGEMAAVSFTFISGDTWVANQDSVSFNPGSKAHYRMRFWEETSGGLMPYRNHSDRTLNGAAVGPEWNNSSCMFSTQPNRYTPSILVESFNSATFDNEHLDVDWVLDCTNCGPISTNDISKEFSAVSIYPNPASSDLTIALAEAKTNDVNVTLYSITGKKLMSTTVAKGNSSVTMDITTLSNGIYLCELESNGQTFTKKVTKN